MGVAKYSTGTDKKKWCASGWSNAATQHAASSVVMVRILQRRAWHFFTAPLSPDMLECLMKHEAGELSDEASERSNSVADPDEASVGKQEQTDICLFPFAFLRTTTEKDRPENSESPFSDISCDSQELHNLSSNSRLALALDRSLPAAASSSSSGLSYGGPHSSTGHEMTVIQKKTRRRRRRRHLTCLSGQPIRLS
jgi:hypothetical protein